MLMAKEFVLPYGISYEEMIKIGGNYNGGQFQDAVQNVAEIEYHKNVTDRSSGNKVYAVFDEPKGCFECPLDRTEESDVYESYCTLLREFVATYGDNEEECPLIRA